MKKKTAFERLSDSAFEKITHEEAETKKGGCHTYKCYPVLTDTGGGGPMIVADPVEDPSLTGGDTIDGQTDYVCGYVNDCYVV